MNETSMIAGDLSPMPATATTSPSVTARLYAGAVEAMPMTTLDSMPTALVFRPLASSAARTVVVALGRGFGKGYYCTFHVPSFHHAEGRKPFRRT